MLDETIKDLIFDKSKNAEIVDRIITEETQRDKLYEDEDNFKKIVNSHLEPGTNMIQVHDLVDSPTDKQILVDKIKTDLIKVNSGNDTIKKNELLIERNLEPERILGVITDKIKLAEQFCDLIPLYYDEAGVFWKFDNTERYWTMVDEVDILNWIRNSAVQNIVSSKERTELLNALKQEARRRKPKELPETFIQFRREIVDLKTGDRIPASKDVFCTNPIPWKIGKSQETPKIDELFKQWVSPDDVQKLYEIIAYCTIPSYPLERFFILYGSGSNGKSVYRQILRKFLGEKNCVSTSLEMLSQSRFESAKLYKKLLCEMGETNLAKLDGTDKLKRAVSGKDLMGAEWKNKGLKDFVNYAKIVISTNNVPPTDDKTDGFFRKTLIIDFPNQFTKEADLMSQIPDSEFENLAAKSLFILSELLKNKKFTNEGDFAQRREKYESHSNPLLKFWKEFIDEEDPNADVPKSEFARRLNEWLKENKHREMSETTIGRFMKERGITETRLSRPTFDYTLNEFTEKRVRVWGGIRWKDSIK